MGGGSFRLFFQVLTLSFTIGTSESTRGNGLTSAMNVGKPLQWNPPWTVMSKRTQVCVCSGCWWSCCTDISLQQIVVRSFLCVTEAENSILLETTPLLSAHFYSTEKQDLGNLNMSLDFFWLVVQRAPYLCRTEVVQLPHVQHLLLHKGQPEGAHAPPHWLQAFQMPLLWTPFQDFRPP